MLKIISTLLTHKFLYPIFILSLSRQVIAGLENFNATNIESAVDEVLLRLLSIKDGQLKQVSAAIEASIKDLEIDMKKVHEEVAKIDFSKRA